MEKFIRHTGIGAPLRRSAVDTDQIIPAVYLKRITRTGFDDALFAGWRAGEPDFILNQEAYKRASVLVAGPDFGTGSSREHAVWALKDYGFRVVLAPRFADIFRGNAGKQGLVAGIIGQEDCEQLWKILETEPGAEVTVDLESRTVEAGVFRCSFEIDDYVRWILMEGLDDISLTLQHEEEIVAYEQRRPAYKPRTLPARHLPKEEVVPARSAEMPVVHMPLPSVRPGAAPSGPRG
ncbi:3-isopropylmalate dehydratase small subunit [Actinomyces bowdenii]|uniref:3-isopropylmalate dehydratase small subunit n=1 Tax=Actinomyces bowdenii TaxID=131109 RepID=A0A3P1V7M8_9ACTO|nr:3-isopropylmalate dehydratase small subunit [Actinomyces bowdenii]RRD29667.1 3-isopropylmalate dehydratase small subunit [Actinomyces bowdenii]